MSIRFGVLCALGILVFLSSCSTLKVQSSGKKGFFDELAERDSKSPRSKRSKTSQVVRARELQQIEKNVAQYIQNWRWPLERVQVTSPFGVRDERIHEGIDFRAPVGTPIYAVDQGKVIYSDRRVSGYGQMIILKHPRSGLLSVYAHLSKRQVRVGQWIKRGQRLGLSGKSGRVSGPHLHFEIRKGTLALDPLRLYEQARVLAQNHHTDSASRVVSGSSVSSSLKD